MKMNWIPVSERLPEKSGMVLICCEFGRITVVNYSAKHKQFNNFDVLDKQPESSYIFTDVVAWAPLPEPYTQK